ncbi:MAG: CPBP family intramembrane metalloprotease [Agathobacter sp.]|nr:CPBP family intramembrane metalloprotease [Agathobacter sp.]
MSKKRCIIFLALTFVLTWVYCLAFVYPYVETSSAEELSMLQLRIAATMFIPAICVVITRLLTKEGFQNHMIKPNLKGNIKTYLLAYFGPSVLTLFGGVVFFLIFPNQFDINCGYLLKSYEALGVDLKTMPMPANMLMLSQGITAILFGPIVNFVTCFGEEWAWRGYMVPKMAENMKTVPMLLVSGVIWGLWHAPLTIVGHNYGMGYWGYPFTGILAMCLFCTMIGIFMSYITLKTKSCIPAVLAHGAINAFASIGIYFTKDGGNVFVGPAPTGVVGMIGFIVLDIFLVRALMKQENNTKVEIE